MHKKIQKSLNTFENNQLIFRIQIKQFKTTVSRKK